MKSIIITLLLVMTLAQFQRDIGAADVEIVVNVSETKHLWIQQPKDNTFQLQFPVDHADDGYSWYLDELYHNCDNEFYTEPWYEQEDASLWFYEEQFFSGSLTDYDDFDNHQKVNFYAEFYESEPNWTFRRSRDYFRDVCLVGTQFNSPYDEPEYGDEVNVAVSWYDQDVVDIDTKCEFCHLHFSTQSSVRNRHFNIPEGVRADWTYGDNWESMNTGEFCDIEFDSTDFTTNSIKMPAAHTDTEL